MHIRAFRPDDLPALKQITVEAFDGVSIDQGIEQVFGPINGHDWRWRKSRHLDEDAAREPDGIFVAEDDGRIVGCITTWHDAEAGIGHIPNLALAPDYRGRGLGRRLIEHALDHFRRLGLTHAKIETLAQNAIGNHLYPSLGFREVARQVHFCADLRDRSAGDRGNG
ncbi:MAG TPA: GNAT family N-acetyltransferase [Planctomycetaceae bacterium]|nr:GNAT family N-acetyltransferase [Planctomycetaceae bacterium]